MLKGAATRLVGNKWRFLLALLLFCFLTITLYITPFIERIQVNMLAVNVVNPSINRYGSSSAAIQLPNYNSQYLVPWSAYLLGVDAAYRQQVGKAIIWLNLSKSSPQLNRLASYRLAELYERTHRPDLAAEEWKNTGTASWRATRYLHLARLSFEAGDYVEGDRLAELAALLEPKSAKPFWLVASVYRTKDNNKMLESLYNGLQRDSSSAWSLVARGLIAEYGTQSDFRAALACYQQALSEDPNHVYAKIRLRDLTSRKDDSSLVGPDECTDAILQHK